MSSRLGVGGASGEVSAIAASDALVVLVGLLGIAWLVAGGLNRRSRFAHRSQGMWFAGVASLALILAVTLFRDGLPTAFRFDALADWSSDGLRRLSRDPFRSSQFVLNIVLFVPAGATWTLISRRPIRSWLAMAGFSLLIESTQAVTGAGANDVADVVANSLGAAIGAVGVVAVTAIVDDRNIELSSRSRRWAAASVAVFVVVLVVGWFVGASSRQQHVEDVLRSQFEGTDLGSIEALMESDSSAVFGAADDYADGTRYSDDSLEIRYPAAFFSLRRCVFVVWTPEGVDFRKASGRNCTDFIDR